MADDTPTTPADTAPGSVSITPAPKPRRIEYRRLNEIKPDPRNPKSHDLALIDQSYSRYGVVEPQTIDDRTGYLISGHGRNLALSEAFAKGDEAPEGVLIDTDGMWLVPINTGWASKNDAEAAAALISMNRLTEMGGWADESLLELLDFISENGANFDGVGFSETDLDDLRHLLEDVPDLDALADEYDPDADPTGSAGGKAVAIKLSDPALISRWHEARDTVKTDDNAMRLLLGIELPAEPTKKKATRVSEPTAEDLTDEDQPDLATLPAALSTAPSTGGELDWSTAAMVAPDAETVSAEPVDEELPALDEAPDLEPEGGESELTQFPTQAEIAGLPEAPDAFETALVDAMQKPLDQSEASAVVPVTLARAPEPSDPPRP